MSRFRPAVVTGAALAGVFWGATGFVALLDSAPDPGPLGSPSFYLIEGGHAVSETAMVIALFALWRSQRPLIGRLGTAVFALAVAATSLLGLLTFSVVGAAALDIVPSMPATGDSVPAPLVALATAVFVFTFVGLVAGYIGSGVTTIRAGLWPSPIGWLLIAHPFLLFTNLLFYPIGIAIGLLWLALAWIARRPAGGVGSRY